MPCHRLHDGTLKATIKVPYALTKISNCAVDSFCHRLRVFVFLSVKEGGITIYILHLHSPGVHWRGGFASGDLSAPGCLGARQAGRRSPGFTAARGFQALVA